MWLMLCCSLYLAIYFYHLVKRFYLVALLLLISLMLHVSFYSVIYVYLFSITVHVVAPLLFISLMLSFSLYFAIYVYLLIKCCVSVCSSFTHFFDDAVLSLFS